MILNETEHTINIEMNEGLKELIASQNREKHRQQMIGSLVCGFFCIFAAIVAFFGWGAGFIAGGLVMALNAHLCSRSLKKQ
jgi:hypothetical protein